jgi:hypothetical protein
MGVQWRVGRSIEGHTAARGQAVIGQGRRGRSSAWEVSVGLAGDVSLEAADDLGAAEDFVEAAGDVAAGAGIGAETGEHDAPERMVRLAVPAPVEPVAAGEFAGGCLEGCDTAQLRPSGFAADSLGIVAGRRPCRASCWRSWLGHPPERGVPRSSPTAQPTSTSTNSVQQRVRPDHGNR